MCQYDCDAGTYHDDEEEGEPDCDYWEHDRELVNTTYRASTHSKLTGIGLLAVSKLVRLERYRYSTVYPASPE